MNMQACRSMARGLLIVLCIFSSPAVLASGQTACRGVDAKLAHERADLAFRNRQYQQAGQCYLIAGDKPRADLAFVKAAAATAPVTKRQLAANANQVKEQLRQLQQIRAALTSH